MAIELLKPDVHARLGIVGHVGCGHANSHCGFVQDDSGGLAAVLTLLGRALPEVDVHIAEVIAHVGQQGGFTVKTASGASAFASARRGVTPFEAQLAQRVVGLPAVCTQALAMRAFGRVLGQGAMEVPVALQTAIANAALQAYAQARPEHFLLSQEAIGDNVGLILGGVLAIDGIAVATMGVVNATAGGIGPNEDIEGNVNLAGKTELMRTLGLEAVPTVLVEGKVCASPISEQIDRPTFVTRAYPGHDNSTVSECLMQAARDLDLPMLYPREMLARSKSAMSALTREMGEKIASLGQLLSLAETAERKVQLAARINQVASEDLGGITFMSNDVHTVMGGVGAIPGTTGCLSLFIPRTQLMQDVCPALTDEDASTYADLIARTIAILDAHLDQAQAELERVRAAFTPH